MAGGSPSTPFWTTNGLASLPNTQGNLKDTQAGAVSASLSSPWAQSSSIETDSSLLTYQRCMQGAHLAAAMSSRGPSPANSPYHFPGTISQRPQLQTTGVNHASSPVPINGRLQGPPTAPAYFGHRSTLSSSHGDLPSDWLSAGAQPLMLGAPWKNHEGGAAHQDHEGVSAGTQNGDPILATPESATTAPLDLGPFEMDPVVSNDRSSAAGAGASASTQERPGDLLPWGQTGAEQAYSQGAEQIAWLSKFLTTLDAQSLPTPASNHIAPSTSLPSENGSVYHSSPPASSPQQQDPDMVQRLYQANYHATQFQLAVNGTHLPAPQDPMSVMMINPNHLPHISKRRSSEDVVPFIDGSRVASVIRSKRGSHNLSSSQISGIQYPSGRPSYSPYQRVSSSPYRRRSHARQLSGSDAHPPNSTVSPPDSGLYLSPQQLHSRTLLHRHSHADQHTGSDAPPPSSTVSPHDSGIFLSPEQLHSRTNSFGSVYTPGPPSVSSSTGSQSRETSLGIFQTPVDQGYEVSGGYFPFPPIHPGADKIHDGASDNTLELVIPTNPIQLPQPLPVPQIMHPVAYPVGVQSAGDAWRPKPHQTKEGKLQIDHAMINASFRDSKDPVSAQRRLVLERILQSIWFQSHELEPKVSGPYDELTGGLGVSGRSVYTCFLKFMTSQEGGSGGSGGKWVCLFGDESHPCPKARWEEGFNKPERAIEHIRSHLGHRPFWCNNECGSNPACTWKFFANSHRYDHWKKPHKRSHCDVCGESVQAQNLVRHLETHAREDA